MNILIDPLDGPQSTLVNLVWPVFKRNRKFPVYNWVEDKMRRETGLDAAEIIGGMPSIAVPGRSGRYGAVRLPGNGGQFKPGTKVSLTMTGLYHVRDDDTADEWIGGVLVFLRAMFAARAEILNHLFDVPDLTVSLSEALANAGREHLLEAVGAIAQNEWLAASVDHHTDKDDWIGELALPVAAAEFKTVEAYLNVLAALAEPEQTEVPRYLDPQTLAREITAFDRTAELVLGTPLVQKLPADRMVLLALDAASYSGLQEGISAVNQLVSDLDVPGRNPSHALGRLAGYLATTLPKLDVQRVQTAIDVLDAVRLIRNSGQHPKPDPALREAHHLLGLSFPIRNPAEAWDIVRAQLAVAFAILHGEIYAARP